MPAQIGHYRLGREIGRGGMGVVYLARDSTLDRDVAIKCLPDELVDDPERLARFEREAKTLASLNHPNIAIVHGLEEIDGRMYLVLEYIDGESLTEYLREHDRSWQKCLDVAPGIADALAAAHARGVVHRDVKPDNLRFTREGHIKVLDFGLACLVRPNGNGATDATTVVRHTMPGAVMGTPGYMAPEQARGHPADTRSDIFAFGCLLYEMLTGRVPFARDTVADSLAATLHEEVEPPSRFAARIPGELDAIVMRCLEKRPDNRFQSARDLAFALRGVSGQSSRAAAPEPGRKGRPYRRRLSAGLLAIACIAAAITWYTQGRGGNEPITSLAVLPFVDDGGETDSAYLGEGIAESIINRMGRVDALSVRSRNASFRFAGREHELADVARELDVRAIITGRISRRGDNLIISVTLEDALHQVQLWGDRFERPVADILQVEADIVDQIASELSLQLSGRQRSDLADSPTQSADAYLAYLEGNFWQSRIEGAAYQRALESYEDAIEIDPDFALAYAGKAIVFCNRGIGLHSPAAEVRPRAESAAKRAVELDPNLAEAHLALGFIHWIWDWDFERSEAQLREAIRLKPELAYAYQILAHVVSSQGRYAEALAISKDATRLEPHMLLFNSCQGHFYSWNGQPQEALQQLYATNEMDPTFGHTHVYLGRELVAQGRADEAIEHLEYLQDSGQRVGDGSGDLGWACALAGRPDDAHAQLALLENHAKNRFVPNIAYARIYAGLRDDEKTIEWLTKSLEAREAVLPLIKNEPHFHHLHDDPRFIAILDRIGLAH